MANAHSNRNDERARRPSNEDEELAGASETSVGRAEGQSDVAPTEHASEAESNLSRKGMSAPPEDLGSRFLEEASEAAEPGAARENAVAEEERHVTEGEQRIREQTPGLDDSEDPLTTRHPNRTEVEEEISEKARQIIQEEGGPSRR